jgi:hypothetical protein
MALNDTQYQVNQIKSQLKVLENQLRSQAPQTAKASPIGTLTNATSMGQVVAGSGSSTDAFSRAIQTTVQGAISGIEALQYVQTAGANFNLGSVSTGTLRTEFLRPDPVIGQVYRATIGGTVSRGGVSPGFVFQIVVNITGAASPAQAILSITPGASTTVDFFLQAMFVTTTAGTAGIMAVNSGGIFGNVNLGPPPLAFISTGGDGCIQAGNIGPGTLVGGSLTFSFNTTALSASSTFGFNCYVLESLGFRTG